MNAKEAFEAEVVEIMTGKGLGSFLHVREATGVDAMLVAFRWPISDTECVCLNVTASGRELRMNDTPEAMRNLAKARVEVALSHLADDESPKVIAA